MEHLSQRSLCCGRVGYDYVLGELERGADRETSGCSVRGFLLEALPAYQYLDIFLPRYRRFAGRSLGMSPTLRDVSEFVTRFPYMADDYSFGKVRCGIVEDYEGVYFEVSRDFGLLHGTMPWRMLMAGCSQGKVDGNLTMGPAEYSGLLVVKQGTCDHSFSLESACARGLLLGGTEQFVGVTDDFSFRDGTSRFFSELVLAVVVGDVSLSAVDERLHVISCAEMSWLVPQMPSEVVSWKAYAATPTPLSMVCGVAFSEVSPEINGFCYLRLFRREYWTSAAMLYGANPQTYLLYTYTSGWLVPGYQVKPVSVVGDKLHVQPDDFAGAGKQSFSAHYLSECKVGGLDVYTVLRDLPEFATCTRDIFMAAGGRLLEERASGMSSGDKRARKVLAVLGDSVLSTLLAVHAHHMELTPQDYQDMRSVITSNTNLYELVKASRYSEGFSEVLTVRVAGELFEALLGVAYVLRGLPGVAAIMQQAGGYDMLGSKVSSFGQGSAVRRRNLLIYGDG